MRRGDRGRARGGCEILVTISGIDCAGKTTQVELLADYLASRGRRVATLWYRPGYSELLNGARALARALRPSALPTTDKPVARARAFSRRGVAEAWIGIAMLDMFAQYAIKLRALRAAGRAVICDRYLDDALLDFELRFPERTRAAIRGVRALRLLAPTPTVEILLTLPRPEMLRRMEAKREPFEDPPAIRERRYDAYLDLVASGKMIAVDASPPPRVVHAEIVGHLERAA